LLQELGKMEDDIFRRRKQKEDGIAASKARRAREEKDREDARKANNAAALAANRPSSSTQPSGGRGAVSDPNKSAAAALKMSLGGKRELGDVEGGSDAKRPKVDEEEQAKNSQAAEEFLSQLKSVMEQKRVVEQEDDVCLHQGGWKQRYYRSKFGVDVSEAENAQFPRRVVQSFMEGICWTLLYYYRGCPSWIWCVTHYTPSTSVL
jgi:5'-3' exoribonuclease 2